MCYQLNNQTISHAGEQLYLSGKPITENVEKLFGAITQNNQIIIAVTDSLIITDFEGILVDQITNLDGLIETPLGIALSKDGTTIVRGGTKYWESTDDSVNWHEYHGPHPQWVAPSITLPTLRQVIEEHDMSRQISLERFLLDAHSGRFFGKYGVYVIDAAAILLLILAITGIWLWSVRK